MTDKALHPVSCSYPSMMYNKHMHYYDVLKPSQVSPNEFDLLLSLGWYPMGQTVFTTSHLFREDETSPPKVHWLRYSVKSIIEKASHRRICKKNSCFEMELADPFVHSAELDCLYEKYLNSLDFDGYATIEKATFKEDELNIYNTKAILIRQGEEIIFCGIFHEGNNSVASILHFYDPEYCRYSPGKFLILKTIEYCKKNGFEWYYPGYVIQGNRKMDYKLFLGEDLAFYYNPEPHPLSGTWQPFRLELSGSITMRKCPAKAGPGK